MTTEQTLAAKSEKRVSEGWLWPRWEVSWEKTTGWGAEGMVTAAATNRALRFPASQVGLTTQGAEEACIRGSVWPRARGGEGRFPTSPADNSISCDS